MSTEMQEQASFGGTLAEPEPIVTEQKPSTNGASGKKMLTRAGMRDVKDFRLKKVEPEGYDFYFYVRSVSAKGALELAELGDIEEVPEGSKKDRTEDIRKMVKIITTCACDEHGAPFFVGPEDEEWLMQRQIQFLTEAVQECMDVNGLTKQGIEDAKGN